MINFRRFAALTLCLFVLSACGIRSWLIIDMANPSNGSVTAEIGFDDQFRETMSNFADGADLLAEIETEAPAQGWTVERFTDEDIEGLRLTRPVTSLEELRDVLQAGIGSGPQEGLVEGLTVTETKNTIRFEASVPGIQDSSSGGGVDVPQLEGLLEVDGRIQVTFPGEVVDHNGELEGRTVTWTFDETQSEPLEMFAEARKGSNRWLLIIGILLIVGILGLGVIGGVVWLVLSNRNRQPRVVSVAPQPNQPTDGD